MKVDEQLRRWVEGDSAHNNDRDECCPDFSCCNSAINTPISVRKFYVEGTDEDRLKLQFWFLQNALDGTGMNVHMIGIKELEQ